MLKPCHMSVSHKPHNSGKSVWCLGIDPAFTPHRCYPALLSSRPPVFLLRHLDSFCEGQYVGVSTALHRYDEPVFVARRRDFLFVPWRPTEILIDAVRIFDLGTGMDASHMGDGFAFYVSCLYVVGGMRMVEIAMNISVCIKLCEKGGDLSWMWP